MKWYLIPYIIGFAKVGFYLFSIHMIEKLTIEEINFIRHDIWKGNRKLPRERERERGMGDREHRLIITESEVDMHDCPKGTFHGMKSRRHCTHMHRSPRLINTHSNANHLSLSLSSPLLSMLYSSS